MLAVLRAHGIVLLHRNGPAWPTAVQTSRVAPNKLHFWSPPSPGADAKVERHPASPVQPIYFRCYAEA